MLTRKTEKMSATMLVRRKLRAQTSPEFRVRITTAPPLNTLATVALPQGTYSLDVQKSGYEAHSRDLDVNGDVTVEVEVAIVPPENPDAYWLFDPTKQI